MTSHSSKAEGVGTVELDMHLEPDPKTGKPNSHKLILHDVLYVPHHICNIFASQAVPNLRGTWGGTGSQLIDGTTGQPAGQSSLDPNGHYVINAYWPEVDRRDSELHNIATDDEPYTKKEKAWLKKHWEN